MRVARGSRWWLPCCLALLVACSTAAPVDPRLVAFVGERISVEAVRLADCSPCFDEAFRARYRVRQVVHGSMSDAEIEFIALDHYGTPTFARYTHVLLFVTRMADGTFVHEKYLHFPVHEASDGRWYGCGLGEQDPAHADRMARQPNERVTFTPAVTFPIHGLRAPDVQRMYPPRFFTYGEQSGQPVATCTHGVPIHALFRMERDGVLRARGLRPD